MHISKSQIILIFKIKTKKIFTCTDEKRVNNSFSFYDFYLSFHQLIPDFQWPPNRSNYFQRLLYLLNESLSSEKVHFYLWKFLAKTTCREHMSKEMGPLVTADVQVNKSVLNNIIYGSNNIFIISSSITKVVVQPMAGMSSQYKIYKEWLIYQNNFWIKVCLQNQVLEVM